MERFELNIGGEPIAQGRPRFSTIKGFTRAFDPKESRNFKQVLQAIAREKMAGEPQMEGALCLYLKVHRVPPQSWPKYKRKRAIECHEGICSKPDLDNYVKIVLDALNGVLFKDDSAVVKICTSKRWAETPGMQILFTKDKENAP